MEKQASRALKVYPWYSAITGDLLFYIAIGNLFLTLVKNFSAAEIVSITSLSQAICIGLQFPILFVIKKIGNNASIRIGAFCLLLSALLITFGKSYYLVLIGRIFHDVAAIFKNTAIVALENNLDLLDKRSDFVRYRTLSNTFYSVITMLISLVASYMFNLNNYLPMFCCITTCALGFVLSFFMKDYSKYNKISRKTEVRSKVKVNYNASIIIIIALYALFFSIVANGQSDGNLFIQENLLLDFDVEKTALIIGIIIFVSRVVRVVSNIVFDRIYKKYMNKVGVAFSVLLCSSLAFMLFGSFIPVVVVKIVIMALGYAIVLFIRDPFKLYIVDVLFESTPKEQHQTLLTVLAFGEKLTAAGMGLAFSAVLLSYPLALIISIMLIISLIVIALSVVLYRTISVGKLTA